jgi:hypothetical protein
MYFIQNKSRGTFKINVKRAYLLSKALTQQTDTHIETRHPLGQQNN